MERTESLLSSARGALAARIAGLYLLGALAFTVAPAAAMVGGAQPAAADGAGRSVVMIDGSHGTVCTASAIARDLLLTAAHCVQPGSEYKFLENPVGAHPALKDIARIERHPQFELKKLLSHVATADLALAKLAEPLPANIPPARLGFGTDTFSVGDRFVVAGYGVTVRGADRLDGLVRAATLVATGQPNTLQLRLVDPRTDDQSSGLGACTGDSGAPVFRNQGGGLAIIGIVSWSTGPKLSAGCGGLTGVTPLERYRPWIIETARTLGTTLAP